jgi:hypothetical protein
LGDSHFPEGRTKNLETPHEVGNEIGELVHRLRQADEGIRSFFVETSHPGRNRERSYEEDPGGLGERPAASGPKLKDGQSSRGWIMGASVGFDLLHPGILDTDLLAKELDLLLQAIPLGLSSELTVHALRRPALRVSQRGSG